MPNKRPEDLSSASHVPSLAVAFWEQVAKRSGKVALIVKDSGDSVGCKLREFTWQQLGVLVLAAESEIEARGIVPGMHLATHIRNSLSWICIDLVCAMRGLVHVAIDAREPAARACELAAMANAKLLIDAPFSLGEACGPLGRSLDSVSVQAKSVDPSSPAMILFTSGSAGAPKAVVLSHRNLVTNACAKLVCAPQSAEDVRLNVLPFSHAYARTCELSTWLLTGGVLATADNWTHAVEIASDVRPSLVNLVPHLADKLASALEQDRDAFGDRLRLVQVGGAGLSNATWHRLESIGLPPLQGYGLTEASPVVCSNVAGEQRPGTVGRAVPGVQLRLDQKRILWTRGEHVMLGYWNDQQETRRRVVDGWLDTGDIAEIDEQGFVRIVGRKSSEIVLSTGYKVSPEVAERLLLALDIVDQAVVIGQNQPFTIALVWPRWHALPPELLSGGCRATKAGDESDLLSQLDTAAFLERVREGLAVGGKGLPAYALPGRVALLTQPLCQASGTLTAKGTARRQAVEAAYAGIVFPAALAAKSS